MDRKTRIVAVVLLVVCVTLVLTGITLDCVTGDRMDCLLFTPEKD